VVNVSDETAGEDRVQAYTWKEHRVARKIVTDRPIYRVLVPVDGQRSIEGAAQWDGRRWVVQMPAHAMAQDIYTYIVAQLGGKDFAMVTAILDEQYLTFVLDDHQQRVLYPVQSLYGSMP